MQFRRYSGNPILSPRASSPWERLVTTNPGVWYDQEKQQVMMLYRAAGDDPEHKVHLGLAISHNGYDFERVCDQPVLSPSADGFDAGCIEDPRIVKFGQWYFVTYACRAFPPGEYWLTEEERRYVRPECSEDFPWQLRRNTTATGLAITRDFRRWIRAGRMTTPLADDRDVILFPEKIGGRYYMLHRPMGWHGAGCPNPFPAMWISSAQDLLAWENPKLLAQGEQDWECKIGGNTPPIRTEHGWLTLYHAVGPDKHYRLGAMLLDLDDPSIVRYRTRRWLLQPEQAYELEGYYKGVCFPCGSCVIGETFFVYYGGADKYVGVATCPFDELLDELLRNPAGARARPAFAG